MISLLSPFLAFPVPSKREIARPMGHQASKMLCRHLQEEEKLRWE